jgi:Cys-rich protein (TIGR01571 family)
MQSASADLVLTGSKQACLRACLCGYYLSCIGAGYNRKAIRRRLNIDGSFFVDCLLECFCSCCAVSQEWRETMLQIGKNESVPIWLAFKK